MIVEAQGECVCVCVCVCLCVCLCVCVSNRGGKGVEKLVQVEEEFGQKVVEGMGFAETG
jgi:hypothetical protein